MSQLKVNSIIPSSGSVVSIGTATAGVEFSPQSYIAGLSTIGVANTAYVGIVTILTGPVSVGEVMIDSSNQIHSVTKLGIGTAVPATAIDAASKTDAIALPKGNTSQRPSGDNPYLRYNSEISALEFYDGSNWVEVLVDYFPTGSMVVG